MSTRKPRTGAPRKAIAPRLEKRQRSALVAYFEFGDADYPEERPLIIGGGDEAMALNLAEAKRLNEFLPRAIAYLEAQKRGRV